MSKSVLVLNSSFEPLHTTSIERAICMIVRGVAVPELTKDIIWHSPKDEFKIPSIIRLTNYIQVPSRSYKLSKRNVFIRDNHTCQYCGKVFSVYSLTVDHVMPRSRGGKTSWENLVAACKKCNNRKDNRTPEEAGMPLANWPKSNTALSHRIILRNLCGQNPDWSKYLFN
jgi:5-methylcytosine-specific restriction endonuclease McrA